MDPRLHAFYIHAVLADFGRRSSRLACLADDGHSHDERPLRRAIRRARRAAGRAREAAEGRPSLALVGGESGVGKSRLADELTRHAREAGARVLSGDCVELGDDELPYAPLLTALRPLVRDGDPSLDALAPQLRSALDAILPGLGGRDSSAEATQSRVFEALLALLEALARGRSRCCW